MLRMYNTRYSMSLEMFFDNSYEIKEWIFTLTNLIYVFVYRKSR